MEKDIGVLLGSSANFVFYEMLEIYPGAKQLYEAIISYGCDCGDAETCGRQAFQLVVNQASDGNPELAHKFIEEAVEKGLKTHEQVRDHMVQYFETHVLGEEAKHVEIITGDRAMSMLEQIFGGRLQ